MNRPNSNSSKTRARAASSHPMLEKELRQSRRDAYLKRTTGLLKKDSLWVQFAVFATVALLWSLPIVNPIKLMAVLVHEISHVIAAYATGGVVFGIAVDPGAAGVTLGLGGNQFLILAAGYTGSILFGAVLYYLSTKWDPTEPWLFLLMLSCASMSLGWLNGFSSVFGVGALVILGGGHFLFPSELKQFLLRVLATTSCLYPVLDIVAEMIWVRPEGFQLNGKAIGGDIAGLAEITGISTIALGLVSSLFGLSVVVGMMRWCANQEASDEAKLRIFGGRRLKPLDPVYNRNDPNNVPEYTIR